MTDVTLEGVTVVRHGRVILDVGAMAFRHGSTTAVFGPNGSGKTTLLRVIAGLERPASGRVCIGEIELGGKRRGPPPTAVAFQEPVFVEGTVRRNLALALGLRRVPAAERTVRIAEVAAECGITPVLDRSARQLSGGEAQRASLARALALHAPVTLLDEPLTGIDRIARTQFLVDLPGLLHTFTTTTVLVTHDREEAFRLADDLVVLVDGAVRAAGPKGDVYRSPPDRTVAELLGYSVLPSDRGWLALPPGALRLGEGEPGFRLRVERVVDLGNHRHVTGQIGTAWVDVRVGAGQTAPTPGTIVPAVATTFVVLPS
jgi:ABC-type sugar transport system ATPase subunit